VFVAAVLVSGCANVIKDYPPPDVDLGTYIWAGSCEKSYGYFEPLFYEGRKEYTKPSVQLAKEKYMLMSVKHYAALQQHVELLENELKKRCR
jgi:hypothetical protein